MEEQNLDIEEREALIAAEVSVIVVTNYSGVSLYCFQLLAETN